MAEESTMELSVIYHWLQTRRAGRERPVTCPVKPCLRYACLYIIITTRSHIFSVDIFAVRVTSAIPAIRRQLPQQYDIHLDEWLAMYRRRDTFIMSRDQCQVNLDSRTCVPTTRTNKTASLMQRNRATYQLIEKYLIIVILPEVVVKILRPTT